MTNTIISDLETARSVIAAFRQGHASAKQKQVIAARRFSTNKREALYATIQEAYGIALALYEAPEALRNEVLQFHHIKVVNRPKSNPWMPLVNLLFGRWSQLDLKRGRFVSDNSAKKYANSFRFFYEHKWPADEISTRLEAHVSKLFSGKLQFGRGLVATEREDRYDHKEEADRTDERALLQNLFSKTRPLTSLPKNDVMLDSGVLRRFVALWGYEKDGQVHVFGEMPGKHNLAANQALKAARHFDAYMKALKENQAKPPSARRDVPVPPTLSRVVRDIAERGEAGRPLYDEHGLRILDIETVMSPPAAKPVRKKTTPKAASSGKKVLSKPLTKSRATAKQKREEVAG